MRAPLLILAALTLHGAAPAPAPNVRTIVAKALAARGGVARLRAVRTVRLAGHITFADSTVCPLLVEMARTGRMRQELTIHGERQIQILNEGEGWALTAGPGRHELRPLSAGEVKNLAGPADYDGPLLDSKAKGFTVALDGAARVEGRPTWVLKVTGPDGDVRRDYIDQRTYLEDKWEGNLSKDGKDVGFESFFRDYQPSGGVMFAHRIDSDRPGQPGGQRIVLDKVEVNLPIQDSVFMRPAAAPADSAGR